jgi:hypothetical protein
MFVLQVEGTFWPYDVVLDMTISLVERQFTRFGRCCPSPHEAQQILTPSEEAILVDFINQSADHRFPQTLHNIESYANLIQKWHIGEHAYPVGENWDHQFLDVLQTHWSKPLNTQWAQAMNPEVKKRWFALVEEFVVKLGIYYIPKFQSDIMIINSQLTINFMNILWVFTLHSCISVHTLWHA